MINIKTEKTCALTSKDRYDILNFAIDAADNGSFLSSFVYERALYIYAALILMEDNADEIREAISADLIEGWDKLIKETDIIQEMSEQYNSDLALLAQEAWTWFDEYGTYATSARGIINLVEQFSGDIVSQAAGRLNNVMEESGAAEVIKIADEWGMNRQLPAEKENKEYNKKEVNSLFD